MRSLSLHASIGVCVLVALPAVVIRLGGVEVSPVWAMAAFGAGIVASAFMLAWAAEAAQKDISGALAIAILALIAVLPEYAVDLYYAFRAGHDAAYEHFAAANMTGSNRLLLGLGWPVAVLLALVAQCHRGGRRSRESAEHYLVLPPSSRLELGFLVILSVIAFLIPLMHAIPVWLGVALIAVFVAYLVQSGRSHDNEPEELVGPAAVIGALSRRARRITVTSLFVTAAIMVLLCAEPFADALVETGAAAGLDTFLLVQWLAPLASEAPEFIVAIMFALRGRGAAAIATLVASKVNQWSLLVGSLPIAYHLGGGGWALPLDGRQTEEMLLTATQALMGVAVILALRFYWWSAVALVGIFGLQFFITDTQGRLILCVVQAIIALAALVVHRRDILPTLRAPFIGPTERRRAIDGDLVDAGTR